MEARRPLLALVLLLAAGAAGAQVYKWVDAEGRAHFSSTPPPGAKASRLASQPSTPAPATPVRTKTWQEKLELSNQRRYQEQEKEAALAKSQKEDDQRCQEARRTLDMLKRERPIYRINGQGEREYMEDTQRQATLDSANQRIATYCR